MTNLCISPKQIIDQASANEALAQMSQQFLEDEKSSGWDDALPQNHPIKKFVSQLRPRRMDRATRATVSMPKP